MCDKLISLYKVHYFATLQDLISLNYSAVSRSCSGLHSSRSLMSMSMEAKFSPCNGIIWMSSNCAG